MALTRVNALFPLGVVGPVIVTTVFTQWVVFFQVQQAAEPEKAAEALAVALALAFLVQAAVSPVLGFFTDWLATRGTRRLAVVTLGAPLLGACFLGLWYVTRPAGVVALLILYSVGFITTFQVYNAVLPCMSDTDRGRLILAAASGILGLGATVVALVAAPAIIEAWSYQGLGLVTTAVLLLTIWPLSFVLVERPVHGGALRPGDVGAGARHVLAHPGVPTLFVGLGVFLYGLTTFNMGLPFLLRDHLEYGNLQMSAFNAVSAVGLPLAMVLVFATFGRVGMRRQAAALIAIGAVSLAWIWRSLGQGQTAIADWWPALVLGGMVLFALVLPSVVLSRYVDELGTRYQGLAFGLNGVVVGVANAAAGLTVTQPWLRQHAPWFLLVTAGSWVVAAALFAWTDPVSARAPSSGPGPEDAAAATGG